MRRLGVFGIVALLTSIVGCNGPDGNAPDSALIGGLPPGFGSDASAFEKGILDDGEVSYAEYERANLMMVECLEQNGIEATEVVPASEDGFLNFNFFRPDDPEGARRADEVFLDCENQYSKYVFSVYWTQNLPTGEQLVERKAELVACLEEAGTTGLSVDPSTTELAERLFIRGEDLSEEQVDCFARYETVLHSEEPESGTNSNSSSD